MKNHWSKITRFKNSALWKYNYFELITIQNLLSSYHSVPLWHIYKNMMLYIFKTEKLHSFKWVICLIQAWIMISCLNIKLKKNELNIWQKNNYSYQKVLKKDNSCFFSLMIFRENRKTTIFKVLGLVIYCIMDNYLCVGYLCLHKSQLY